MANEKLCELCPKTFTNEDEYKILNSVSPEKDVDGFHHQNMGKLMLNKHDLLPFPSVPCTAEGCFRLLKHYKINILGKHIVIVGSSKVVGLPLSLLLLHNGATTTLCNIHTEYWRKHIQLFLWTQKSQATQ